MNGHLIFPTSKIENKARLKFNNEDFSTFVSFKRKYTIITVSHATPQMDTTYTPSLKKFCNKLKSHSSRIVKTNPSAE